tara:strand:+ start:3044 stop:3559 length:516 start_codon:yes stop_codon:yes gene_type:complete
MKDKKPVLGRVGSFLGEYFLGLGAENHYQEEKNFCREFGTECPDLEKILSGIDREKVAGMIMRIVPTAITAASIIAISSARDFGLTPYAVIAGSELLRFAGFYAGCSRKERFSEDKTYRLEKQIDKYNAKRLSEIEKTGDWGEIIRYNLEKDESLGRTKLKNHTTSASVAC